MQQNTDHIDNIIFDLGGVILNIDPFQTVSEMKKLGIGNFDAVYAHLRHTHTLDKLEKGLITQRDFIDDILRQSDQRLTDEQVLMCPDIMSTGFAGAESGNIRIGDTVAVFAQGPIGLCATAGAKLKGATTIITVDAVAERLEISKRMGASYTVDFNRVDPVDEIMRITDGRGVDVAIEALGLQQTFESCLRVLKPGGTLSSLGVYSQDLKIPLDAFHAGLGDNRIITSLCPGGKERMRRLMNVIASGSVDLEPLVTHRYRLDDIVDAYDLFSQQRDGVLKVAVTP